MRWARPQAGRTPERPSSVYPGMTLSVTAWHELLHDYNAKFLDNSRWLRVLEENGLQESIEELVGDEGWLGREPASTDAVVAAEERLGLRLPPTYRNFLLASNGFRHFDGVDLFAAEEIGRLHELQPELVEIWSEFSDDSGLAVLTQSLLIAQDDGGPGIRWLLHPGDADENGEWAAFSWYSGSGHAPDEGRHASFGALAQDVVRRVDAH